MNLLATLVGLVLLAGGLIGTSLPGSLVSIARANLTPTSLYVVASVTVVSGCLQILAAGRSRMPRTVRAAGFGGVVSGLLLAVAGLDRVTVGLSLWLALGPTNIRIAAACVAALGVTLVYGSARFTDVLDVSHIREARTAQTIAR